jgi:hypothetical protein
MEAFFAATCIAILGRVSLPKIVHWYEQNRLITVPLTSP